MTLGLRVRRWTFGTASPVRLDFDVAPGDYVTVTGPSGSGKTEAALRMVGALPGPPDRWYNDAPILASAPDSRLFSLVPSDPHLMFSLVGTTLAEELALSFAFVGRPIDTALYSEVVTALQLDPLLGQAPLTLSGGEAMRAALAMAILREAPILVLDDVWDELHHDSATIMQGYLKHWRDVTGGAVLDLNRGQPKIDSTASFSVGARRDFQESSSCAQLPFHLEGTCSVEQLAASYRGNTRFSLGPISASLNAGDIVALTGPNGAGKTTMLRSIAGITPSQRGVVTVAGQAFSCSAGLDSRARYMQFVFQNPDFQLSLATVTQELGAAARHLGRDPIGVLPIADILNLKHLLGESPFEQPRSVRRLITVGSAFASGVPVVLLDEPTTGLDDEQERRLRLLIREYAHCGGSVVFVSHDRPFVDSTATVEWELVGGTISGVNSRRHPR